VQYIIPVCMGQQSDGPTPKACGTGPSQTPPGRPLWAMPVRRWPFRRSLTYLECACYSAAIPGPDHGSLLCAPQTACLVNSALHGACDDRDTLRVERSGDATDHREQPR